MAMSVRVGILGCARIAQSAIIEPVARVQGMDVVAIASRDIARAEAFARTHGIALAHDSYEALIADPGIDAIYNPLPNSLHAEWSIRALRAGKGVLCEKPFAANARSASLMATCARETGLPLMEAVHYRFHPLALFIDELIRAQQLGEIIQIDAGMEVAGRFVPPADIRFQHGLSGGAMMDLGTYCVDALRWISGQEPRVVAAQAVLAAPDVDGGMTARFAFPSGAQGSLRCSFSGAGVGGWLTVVGTGGRLHVHNPFHPQLGHAMTIETREGSERRTFDPTPSCVFQAHSFARLCRGEVSPTITPEDSVRTMQVIDAAYLACGLSLR